MVVHNSAKSARDAGFQEVLPLKGKIANAFKSADVIENEEVLSLLTALGYDPSLDQPFKNLRVGRVVLLMDGDVDGLHIQNLVLSTILRFIPDIINEGRVYICIPYEYMVRYKDTWYFDETMEGLMKQVPPSVQGNVMHIKGLGEIDADVLGTMAFDPKVRRLVKLNSVTAKELKAIAELAGDDGTARKKLLGV